VSLTEELETFSSKPLITSKPVFRADDMDWREVMISLRPAIYGLIASGIFLALFHAFLAAHPV
jgi:hypothetical protein